METNAPLNDFWASSQDPTKVSTTVTGLITACSAFIIEMAMMLFHITITATDVTSLATGLGMFAGGIVFLVGVSHKIIHKFGKAR